MENERYNTMNPYDLARKADELLRQAGFTYRGIKRKTGDEAHKAHLQYLFERRIKMGGFRGEKRQ